MLNIVQTFCPNYSYPLYNILVPAILTFIIGLYVRSTNRGFGWSKLQPYSKSLIAITLGYGFIYPVYNLLLCPVLVGNNLINILFFTQPLTLALGFILAPGLNSFFNLLASISTIKSGDKSDDEKFDRLISWLIAAFCLLGLYFLSNALEVIISFITNLEAFWLIVLTSSVKFAMGLVGLKLWTWLLRNILNLLSGR